MYEEKKLGWRAYRARLIAIGLAWLFLIAMAYTKNLTSDQAMIYGAFFSLVVLWLGAQENELRYQNVSHIFCENGFHFSYHPHAVHHKGKWTMIAGGGFSAGGIELKGGEGTLVFPTALLSKTATNPPKILYLRGAPVKCALDGLPQEARDYIVHSGFGELKEPFYFTITPVIDDEGDSKLKKAIISLSSIETEMKDLNKQVAERDRIIRDLLALREEMRDYKRPWWKIFTGGKKETEEA